MLDMRSQLSVWPVLAMIAGGWGWTGVLGQEGQGQTSGKPQGVLGEIAPAEGVSVARETMGRARSGEEIPVCRLSRSGPSGKPSVLLIGGLDPLQLQVPSAIEQLAAKVASTHAAALEHGDLYVVPSLLDRRAARSDWSSSRVHSTDAKIDEDRDSRVDEDVPKDLNGDGRVLWMRVKDPRPGSGLVATHVSEPDDPRLLRPADSRKGERPVFALLPESDDIDGDGLFGEDPPLGVDLDRNFPYHWPEYSDDAGRYALSEPETRALADFLLARPNIVAVVHYGDWDNLVNVPESGKFDQTGEAPQGGHVLDGDRWVFADMSKLYKDAVFQKEAPGAGNDGTLQGWAYAQLGLWSFAGVMQVRPDQLTDDARKALEPPKPDEKSASEEPKDKPPEKKVVDSSEGKWLAFADARGAGFVDWQTFEHPRLGTVEIGGFIQGFREDVAPADVNRLAAEHAGFVASVLERLPKLEVGEPVVESLGMSTWRVTIRVTNVGKLPTRSEMGVRTRRLPPTRIKIDLPVERLLAGERTRSEASIAPGASITASWTIQAKVGDKVPILLASPECGDRVINVELSASPSQGK